MAEEHDPTGDSPVGSSQADGRGAETATAADARRTLLRLLRKRLKKFLALAPQVSVEADPKIIHDVRVWSRRLQQAVSALFPKPRSGKVRRLRRIPRRIRRALGEWRNCDVLLEMVVRRERRTRSEAKRQAWEFVRAYLHNKRGKEVARAGKKLARAKLGDCAALARRLLSQAPEQNPELPLQRIRDSVEAAWLTWQSALTRARESRAVSDLHGFRIATKGLRYRTELLYDVGQSDLKPQLKWLANLQDELGEWHDRQVLYQTVAEAVGRAEILLTQLSAARILLAEVEAQGSRESQAVEQIFRLASAHSSFRPVSAAPSADAEEESFTPEAERQTREKATSKEVRP